MECVRELREWEERRGGREMLPQISQPGPPNSGPIEEQVVKQEVGVRGTGCNALSSLPIRTNCGTRKRELFYFTFPLKIASDVLFPSSTPQARRAPSL